MEIRAPDLALDAAGAGADFLAGERERHSRDGGRGHRTDRRVAGRLYLAALIARTSQSDELVVSGEDRYVADYLYRESLMQLPESTQHFLRRTAVLDRLSAPLCDAVLGQSGSQNQLRRLEASNSFLISLDRRRQWYRYHALFREFLLGELRRVGSEGIAKLHLRAADWYESNGSPAMAVEHLLNTTERDRCVQLVTQLGRVS
jgi:LuxR family maltose regulon positive regulatory protein